MSSLRGAISSKAQLYCINWSKILELILFKRMSHLPYIIIFYVIVKQCMKLWKGERVTCGVKWRTYTTCCLWLHDRCFDYACLKWDPILEHTPTLFTKSQYNVVSLFKSYLIRYICVSVGAWRIFLTLWYPYP